MRLEDGHPCSLHVVAIFWVSAEGQIGGIQDVLVVLPRIAMHKVAANAKVGAWHPSNGAWLTPCSVASSLERPLVVCITHVFSMKHLGEELTECVGAHAAGGISVSRVTCSAWVPPVEGILGYPHVVAKERVLAVVHIKISPSQSLLYTGVDRTLKEDGRTGQRVVPLHNVVQIGVRLAPDIWQGYTGHSTLNWMAALIVDS